MSSIPLREANSDLDIHRTHLRDVSLQSTKNGKMLRMIEIV